MPYFYKLIKAKIAKIIYFVEAMLVTVSHKDINSITCPLRSWFKVLYFWAWHSWISLKIFLMTSVCLSVSLASYPSHDRDILDNLTKCLRIYFKACSFMLLTYFPLKLYLCSWVHFLFITALESDVLILGSLIGCLGS